MFLDLNTPFFDQLSTWALLPILSIGGGYILVYEVPWDKIFALL
ncbi:MAG TPA: hypothetical protein VMT04_01595 [Terriglobales bacterium]|nr:hypothetical protein [Terriglobales bacterium]